jgi:hypothetical protein
MSSILCNSDIPNPLWIFSICILVHCSPIFNALMPCPALLPQLLLGSESNASLWNRRQPDVPLPRVESTVTFDPVLFDPQQQAHNDLLSAFGMPAAQTNKASALEPGTPSFPMPPRNQGSNESSLANSPLDNVQHDSHDFSSLLLHTTPSSAAQSPSPPPYFGQDMPPVGDLEDGLGAGFETVPVVGQKRARDPSEDWQVDIPQPIVKAGPRGPIQWPKDNGLNLESRYAPGKEGLEGQPGEMKTGGVGGMYKKGNQIVLTGFIGPGPLRPPGMPANKKAAGVARPAASGNLAVPA